MYKPQAQNSEIRTLKYILRKAEVNFLGIRNFFELQIESLQRILKPSDTCRKIKRE